MGILRMVVVQRTRSDLLQTRLRAVLTFWNSSCRFLVLSGDWYYPCFVTTSPFAEVENIWTTLNWCLMCPPFSVGIL